MFGGKNYVTKTNEHSNVATFVHALVCTNYLLFEPRTWQIVASVFLHVSTQPCPSVCITQILAACHPVVFGRSSQILHLIGQISREL